MKYRKKPVVIEAWHFDGSWESAKPIVQMGDKIFWSATPKDFLGEIDIETIEGRMVAKPGDWIICGIKGELYLCKPDIFAATYEPA